MLSQLCEVDDKVHRIAEVTDAVGALGAQGEEWSHCSLDALPLPVGLKHRLVNKGERERALLLRSVHSIGPLLPEDRPVPPPEHYLVLHRRQSLHGESVAVTTSPEWDAVHRVPRSRLCRRADEEELTIVDLLPQEGDYLAASAVEGGQGLPCPICQPEQPTEGRAHQPMCG